MEDEWILLGFWPSMFAARARIALMEKGINYEYREEELSKGLKSSLLLEMNPIHKKVPVLIHNGKPIIESLNIVQYIDEVFKDTSPQLLPSDPYERAQARFWADFIDKKVFEAATKVLWYKNKEELDEGSRQLLDYLKLLEGTLGDKPYFGGKDLGYLDIALGGYSFYFYTYDNFGKLDLENVCSKLMAWYKRCMNRESFSKSLKDPLSIYEYQVKARG